MTIAQLLELEYLKHMNKRTYALLIVFLLVNAIALVLMYSIHALPIAAQASEAAQVAQIYSMYFQQVHFLPASFVVLLVINNAGYDLTQGTLRRHIIDGCSRHDYFLAKLYSLLMIAAVVFVLSLLEMILIGALRQGYSLLSLLGSLHLSMLIRWYLLFVAYAIIGYAIINVVRNSSTAIVIYLGSIVAEKMLGWIIMLSSSSSASNYLPYQVIDQIMGVSAPGILQILGIVLYLALLLAASFGALTQRDI
jgi:ABC-type transport system involved in multi-copper enzyme maturation permease subunit